MQKIVILIFSLILTFSGYSKTANIAKARILADQYFKNLA